MLPLLHWATALNPDINGLLALPNLADVLKRSRAGFGR
jgi:hypothetical protein